MALWVRVHHAHTASVPEILGESALPSLEPREREELASLATERDPELRAEGMLAFAGRLEQAGRIEQAAAFYSTLSTPGSLGFIQIRAQQRLHAITGTGATGPRAEFLLRQLSREVLDPAPLAGMFAAASVFRLTRLATLARMGASARVPANLLAFGAEALTFPLGTRLAATALGRDLDWHPSAVGREIGSSFIFLGALRMTGSLGRVLYPPAGTRPALQGIFQQGSMLGGILLAHRLEEAVGLRAHVDGATTLIDSLALLLQFHVAGRLSHGLLGERFQHWEQGMDALAESLIRPRRFPNLTLLPAPQGLPSGGLGGVPSIPSRDLLHGSRVFMTAGAGGAESGLRSRPSLVRGLQRLSQIEDPRAVETALRLFYIGSITPMRQELFETMVAAQEGQPIAARLEALIRDSRIRQTRFFSPEVWERFIKQIEDSLPVTGPDGQSIPRVGSRRISEVLRFLRGPFEPLHVSEDRMLLDILRFRELSRVGASPSRSLSAKEALREMDALGNGFVADICNLIKNSDVDFLTGFLNRRGLERKTTKLEHRLIALQRIESEQKLPDVVLMADIDKFKIINDTRGHDVGDIVLRNVARILEEGTRHRDVRARYGGEEFLLFLAKAGREGGLRAAENLRAMVERTPITVPRKKTEAEAKDPNVPDTEEIFVTISIGAAELRMIPAPPRAQPQGPQGDFLTHDGALENATKRADEALYVAKESGRNRVSFSSR